MFKPSARARIKPLEDKNWKIIFALFSVLLLAVGLRLLFFTGMVRGDSLNYAHAAYEMSVGSDDLGSWAGVSRLGMLAPVAALYSVFGPSEISTLAFPFLFSIINVIFLYLIGKALRTESAGIIAAFLWAVFPLDIFLASSLLPDVPVATLCTGALYFTMLGVTKEKLINRYSLTGLIFVIVAVLVKPIAIMALLAFGVVLVESRKEQIAEVIRHIVPTLSKSAKRLGVFLGAGLLTLVVSLYANAQPFPISVTLAKSANDLVGFLAAGLTELDISGERIGVSHLLSSYGVLFLVSTIWLIVRHRQFTQIKHLLIWTAVIFLYYEWGSINLNPLFFVPIQEFNEARNFLFLMPPIIAITGIYIADLIPEGIAWATISGLAGATLLAGLAAHETVSAGLALPWMSFAALMLPAMSISSIYFVKMRECAPQAIIAITLLLAFAISALMPNRPYHVSWFADRIDQLSLLRRGANIILEDADRPVTINGKGNAMLLNYASNFELGFDWVGNGARVDATRIVTGMSEIEGAFYQLSFVDGVEEDAGVLEVDIKVTTLVGEYGQLRIEEVDVR